MLSLCLAGELTVQINHASSREVQSCLWSEVHPVTAQGGWLGPCEVPSRWDRNVTEVITALVWTVLHSDPRWSRCQCCQSILPPWRNQSVFTYPKLVHVPVNFHQDTTGMVPRDALPDALLSGYSDFWWKIVIDKLSPQMSLKSKALLLKLFPHREKEASHMKHQMKTEVAKKYILVSLMSASLLEDKAVTNQGQVSLLQQGWCFEIVLEVELSWKGGWCG